MLYSLVSEIYMLIDTDNSQPPVTETTNIAFHFATDLLETKIIIKAAALAPHSFEYFRNRLMPGYHWK